MPCVDADLAALYGVSTKRFNEQFRRNAARFPEDFMFRLSAEEWNSLRSQFATLKAGRGQHRKYLPVAFTEHGAIMAATISRAERLATRDAIESDPGAKMGLRRPPAFTVHGVLYDLPEENSPMRAQLRRLVQPDSSRWQPMLMGLACLAAAAGGAVLAQDYWLISLLFSVLAFAAWVVGACAMVGYVRWLYSAEASRLKGDREL